MSHHAFRHLYSSGERGFQTIAASRQLVANDRLADVEELVAGYGNAPQGEGEPPTRQLLHLPGTGAYALSTLNPLAPAPGSRAGNFVAETYVVPEAWLEAALWDAAAAFAALPWMDSREAAELSGDLEAVPLAPLAAGSLDRLQALAEVPDAHLVGLIQRVASPGATTFSLLEPEGAAPDLLEKVVLLTPLLTHPAFRRFSVQRSKRCLTLRSRSPALPMTPLADVTGYPLSAYGRLQQEERDVVDLSGRVPLQPAPHDPAAEAYAHWLKGVIREGAWGRLQEAYAQAPAERSAAAWLATFRRSGGASAKPARPAASAQPNLPSAKRGIESLPAVTAIEASRQAAWQARAAAEAKAAQLVESYRQNLEGLLETSKAELDQAAAAASKRLETLVERKVTPLAEQIDDLKRGGVGGDAGKSLRRQAQRIDTLEKRLVALAKEGPAQGTVAATAASSRRSAAPEAASPVELDLEVRRGSASTVPFWRSLLKPGKAGGDRWVAPLALVALLAVLGIGYFSVLPHFLDSAPGQSRSVEQDPQVPPGPTPAELRRETRAELVEALRDRSLARAVVERAAGEEDLARRAEIVTLQSFLGVAELPQRPRVALLQAALGIDVDGQWGPGSARSLAGAESACSACPERGEAETRWDGWLAGCYLNEHLELIEDSCAGDSPWRRGRVWTAAEAGNALQLIRQARERATDVGLLAEVPSLAAARTASLGMVFNLARPLPASSAEAVFDLAYAIETGDPAAEAPEDVPEGQLEDLETLLSGLGTGGR